MLTLFLHSVDACQASVMSLEPAIKKLAMQAVPAKVPTREPGHVSFPLHDCGKAWKHKGTRSRGEIVGTPNL